MAAVGSLLRRPALVTGLLLIGLVAALALLAPLLAPFPPDATAPGGPTLPAPEHPLGTDTQGRDILARTLYGAQTSLAVAVSAGIATTVLGLMVGVAAGWWPALLGGPLLSVATVVASIPALMLAALLCLLLAPDLPTLALIVAAVGWPRIAREVAGQTSALAGGGLVLGLRAMGAGTTRTLASHVVPALAPSGLASALSAMAAALLLEVSLSFLGIGVPATLSSLGSVAYESWNLFPAAPSPLVVGGSLIVMAALGFTLAGGALAVPISRAGDE